jgi:hypothetical protein
MSHRLSNFDSKSKTQRASLDSKLYPVADDVLSELSRLTNNDANGLDTVKKPSNDWAETL